MLIKDLPIEIQEIVFERQKEQGNKPNNELKLTNGKNLGNFDWNETIEGGDFWSGIENEYYLEFYEKYPKKEDLKPEDKKENMETKFKIGDKVKIINRHPDNTTGSPPFNRRTGMIAYICKDSTSFHKLNSQKDASGNYYGLLSKTNTNTNIFQDSDLELISEEELPTESLVFGQYKIGDIVVSLENKSPYRNKGDLFKVLPHSSETRLYYEKDTQSSEFLTWRKATKKEEEAYNNGIKNIKDIITIDTYGLNVGDFLPNKVIRQWSEQGFNYNQLGKSWQKKSPSFVSDRKIVSFKVFDSIVGFEVSGSSTIYLRAEGFKEFMDNFDKPKEDEFNFIENKWYEVTKADDLKYIIQVGKKTNNVIYFHIGIRVSTKEVVWDYRKNDWCFSLSEIKDYKLLTDLSEIQEYLPDNHLDKVKIPKKVDMLEIQEEFRLAKEDEKKWFEYCRSINNFISFKEFIELPNSRPSVDTIESKNENQSFKIKTKNSLLDTSIEKVPTITSELKQKSKTIKF